MRKNGIRQRMILKARDEDAWYIDSDSNREVTYKVTLHSCECKSFQFRGGYCKHMDKLMNELLEELDEDLDNMEKDDLVKLLELSIQLAKERKEKRLQGEFNP